MRTTRHIWLIWVAVASVAATFPCRPANGTTPASEKKKADVEADVKITKFHLVETKDGKTLWEVWGDQGEVFEKADIAKVIKISNPVTVALYSERGKLTVRSDSATVNMRTKDIRMEQNVTATSEQGNSLQTQSLDWSAKDRRIATRLPVTLTRGGMTSTGVGMEAETDLERVRFLSRVRSQIISESSAGLATTGRSSPQNGGTQ